MGKERVRKFSGETTDAGRAEDPVEWINDYEHACYVNDWDTDRKQIQHLPFYLSGEAKIWYNIWRAWMNDEARRWLEAKEKFIERFLPVAYQQELIDRLSHPKQKSGESVNAYGDRYKNLYQQANPPNMNLDFCTRYWISGLDAKYRSDVRKAEPSSWDQAILEAMKYERIGLLDERDDINVRVGQQKVKKGHSATISAANKIADRLSYNDSDSDDEEIKIPGLKDATPKQLRRFTEEMGPEVVDSSDMDELVKRFNAWHLFSKLYKDPALVKARVLQATPVKGRALQTTLVQSPSTTPRKFSTSVPRERRPLNKNECAYCHSEGHWAKECPELQKRTPAMRTVRHAAAYEMGTIRSSDNDDDDDDVINSDDEDSDIESSDDEELLSTYLATRKIKTFAAKRTRDVHSSIEVDIGPSKRSKETVKSGPRPKADPEVLNFVRQTSFPLHIVARHGAHLGVQVKKAIQETWNHERLAKRKGKDKVPAMLSHALVVPGRLGHTNCANLVIDPGASTSLLDLRKAQEASIDMKTNSRYVIQLADGTVTKPAGETRRREQVNVQGVKVDLRMPIVDSKGTYDILLGRDWLHAVQAIGDYANNTYTISKDGKEVLLTGKVTSPSSSALPRSTDNKSESDDGDGDDSDSDKDQEISASSFFAHIHRLEDFDITATASGMGSLDRSEIPQQNHVLSALEALPHCEFDINPNLTVPQRAIVEKILYEFRDRFASSFDELEQTNVVQHEINLKTDSRPYYCPWARRFSPAEEKFIKEDLEREVKAGIIEEYDGPWCAPITLAKKKDGSFRKCVDYRKLNDMTERESWPLPNIEELLERMAGNEWYSTCDGFSGYFAISLREEDRPKTTFRTPFGTYAYLVMPFGLKNAPHTYSRFAYKTFEKLIGKFIEAYMDDNCTYSTNFEDHCQHVRRMMEAARRSGLKFKVSKCHFFYPEIEFTGHIVGKGGLKVMPDKIEKIRDWPTPKDKKDVQSFLGLAGYYRRFVQNFAAKASPLSRLTRKSEPFEWLPLQEQSFQDLKTALLHAPVLAKPRFDEDWILDTDASNQAIGAVLGQLYADQEVHPVYFWSKQLSKAEQNYSTTDRECLAIVAACRKFRPYILGRHVTIHSDHSAIRWLLNKPDLSGRHARWQVILSEFDYEVVTRSGNRNGNADSLSRYPDHPTEEDSADPEMAFLATVVPSIWKEDLWYRDIYTYLDTLVTAGSTARERQNLRHRARRYVIDLGYMKYRDSDGELKRCVLSKDRKEILKQYHDHGGHFGRDITIKKIRQKYWWPSIWYDVWDHIRHCSPCQRFGPTEHRNPLLPYQPVFPFEFLFMDYLVGLPRTSSRNSCIVTATDGMTKWIEAKATRSADSMNAARFLSEVVNRFGFPSIIVTDNGSHFHGEFDLYCKEMNIEHRFVTPYHPQSNGQDERTHRLLLDRIRRWTFGKNVQWDTQLSGQVLACNTRPVETTGFTPMQALMGYTAHTRHDLENAKHDYRKHVKRSHPYPAAPIASRLTVLESLRDESQRIRTDRTTRWQMRQNPQSLRKPFELGDLVLLFDSASAANMSNKLASKWLGPCTITWKGSQGAYRIQLPNGHNRLVSGDNLKRYHL
jgi:hypothetical protein